MGLLQYTSDEMFSSTELVRKSKMVFDKLNDNEIEKAIILRDGKPSFILYDFKRYESLAKEYLEIKKELDQLKALKNSDTIDITTPKEDQNQRKTQIIDEEDIIPVQEISDEIDDDIQESIKSTEEDIKSDDEINDEDLSNALAQIDNLDFMIKEQVKEKKAEPLKEFWD